MLQRYARRLGKTRGSLRRGYASAGGVSYSPKTRAFPFAVSQDEALKYAAPLVSFFGMSMMHEGVESLLSALAMRFLPGKSREPPQQPKKIAAFYIPGWLIDADMEAKLWATEHGGEQKLVTATFRNSYMPGLAHDPICRMSFKDVDVKGNPDFDTAIPWTDDLMHQWSTEIHCLPFTVTPLGLQDAARSLSPEATVIQSDFRIDPASITTRFMAAYPLLVPIYLIQYEVLLGPMVPSAELTLAVDASQKEGCIIVSNTAKQCARLIRDATGEEILKRPREGLFGDALRKAHEADLYRFNAHSLWPRLNMQFAFIDSLCNGPHDSAKDELQTWIDDSMSTAGAMDKYQQLEQSLRKAATGSEGIDWDDPRIREYNAEECAASALYQNARKKYLQSQGKALGRFLKLVGGSDAPDTTITRQEKERQAFERFAPEWHTAWEKQHVAHPEPREYRGKKAAV